MNAKEQDPKVQSKKNRIMNYAMIAAILAILLFFFYPRGSNRVNPTTSKYLVSISNFSINWADFDGECIDTLPDLSVDICVTNHGREDSPETSYNILFQAAGADLVTFDTETITTFPSLSMGEETCDSLTLPLSQLGAFSEMEGINLKDYKLAAEDSVYVQLHLVSGRLDDDQTMVILGGNFLSSERLGEDFHYNEQMRRMLPDLVFTAFSALEPLPVCVN